MDGACNKAMPNSRKAGRQLLAPRDRGKESYRVRKQIPLPSVRKSARLQERGDRCIRHILADTGATRIRPLPSPSSSDTHSKERSQPCTQADRLEQGKRERSTSQVVCRKRKDSQDIEDLTSPSPDKPVKKQRRSLLPYFKDLETVPKDSNCHPVEFWAKHQIWPPDFAEKDPDMSEQNPKKRSCSSTYTQGVREGQNPKAHTLAHEREMARYNMVMDIFQNQTTISDESKQLCADLLSARYEFPKDSLFEENIFMAVFRAARARKVTRDITPWLVPSAELLHIRNVMNLEHVIEELSAEWTQCGTIFGPRPKSDYVAGLAQLAQLQSAQPVTPWASYSGYWLRCLNICGKNTLSSTVHCMRSLCMPV